MSALTDVCQQVNTVGEIWREREGASYFGRCRSGHSKEGGRERGRVETNEPRKETKETLLLLLSSPSVLRRQKGAKWVIIVFYTDKDREGEVWVWVF